MVYPKPSGPHSWTACWRLSSGDHIAGLRALLAPGDGGTRRLHSVPGCWDGLTAHLIAQAGFPVGFVSGSAIAMARLGRADLGLVTATELAEVVMAIRDRVNMPLLVDGDTGFGNALNLKRSVRSLERAGASAIQIEDQGFPKRCGHLAGKTVIPLAEAKGRIAAALDSRNDVLIAARTDALSVEGLSSAMDRAEAFIEVGADMVFIEGPRNFAELQQIAARFGSRVPLIHNLVEGGNSPEKDGAVLERIGFAIALHPLLLLQGFVRLAPDLLGSLRKNRSSQQLERAIGDLFELNKLVGLADDLAFGERFAG